MGKNRVELERGARHAAEIGIGENLIGVMEPWPLRGVQGMALAVSTFRRSLDIGRYAATIQYSTAWKLRSAVGNLWQPSPKGQGDAVMARDAVQLFVNG